MQVHNFICNLVASKIRGRAPKYYARLFSFFRLLPVALTIFYYLMQGLHALEIFKLGICIIWKVSVTVLSHIVTNTHILYKEVLPCLVSGGIEDVVLINIYLQIITQVSVQQRQSLSKGYYHNAQVQVFKSIRTTSLGVSLSVRTETDGSEQDLDIVKHETIIPLLSQLTVAYMVVQQCVKKKYNWPALFLTLAVGLFRHHLAQSCETLPDKLANLVLVV